MVLTRHQLAAQEEALAAAIAASHDAPQVAAQSAALAASRRGHDVPQVAAPHELQASDLAGETAIVEYPRDPQPPTTLFNQNSSAEVASLAQHFISQTQALAAEQAMLQYRQLDQSNTQSTALMAVQASAQANVKLLSEQQQAIAERLGQALMATQTAVREEFQQLQLKENDKSAHIERFVNEKLKEAIQEIRRQSSESEMLFASQSDRARAQLEEVDAHVQQTFDRLQISESESKAHIEVYIREKLAAALEQIQDRVSESRLAISSHADGDQEWLDEIKTYITSNIEGIPARIDQVVGEKVADLTSARFDDAASQLVRKMVDESCVNSSETIKKGLAVELQRVREELQRGVANEFDEQMNGNVRRLVLELTKNVKNQIEAQVQRALTNTQGEVNLQVQRQADAISALGERLSRHIARETNTPSIDNAAINTASTDMMQSEPDVKFECESDHGQMDSTLGSTIDRGHFAQQLNATIKHSIQEAAATIGNAIQSSIDGLGANAGHTRRHAHQFSEAEDDEDVAGTDGLHWVDDEDEDTDDEALTEEDVQLEQRIQNAWRRTYLAGNTGPSQMDPNANLSSSECMQGLHSRTTQQAQHALEQPVGYRGSADDGFHLHNNPTNVVFVLQPVQVQDIMQPRPCLSSSSSNQALEPVNQTREQEQQQRDFYRPVARARDQQNRQQQRDLYRPTTRRNNLQDVVTDLQRQMHERADAAARRYTKK